MKDTPEERECKLWLDRLCDGLELMTIWRALSKNVICVNLRDILQLKRHSIPGNFQPLLGNTYMPISLVSLSLKEEECRTLNSITVRLLILGIMVFAAHSSLVLVCIHV